MCAESYTVGPQMYHPTRLPSRGTNGTFVRVNVFISRGPSRRGPSAHAAAACSGRHHEVGGWHAHPGPKGGNVMGADMVSACDVTLRVRSRAVA